GSSCQRLPRTYEAGPGARGGTPVRGGRVGWQTGGNAAHASRAHTFSRVCALNCRAPLIHASRGCLIVAMELGKEMRHASFLAYDLVHGSISFGETVALRAPSRCAL